MNTAILIIGHGSRDNEAVTEFFQLQQQMSRHLPEHLIATGFLQLAEPSIATAIAELVKQGATAIYALPGMLMPGSHVNTDIPTQLQKLQSKYQIPICYGRELGAGANMLLAAQARIEAAEAETEGYQPATDRQDTLLLVVSSGSSNPEATTQMEQAGRHLQQHLGFAGFACAYSSQVSPSVTHCLEQAKAQGYKRVMLFPYFLFTGYLVKRVYRDAEHFAKRNEDMDIIQAHYFDAHENVINTLIQRLQQLSANNTSMS